MTRIEKSIYITAIAVAMLLTCIAIINTPQLKAQVGAGLQSRIASSSTLALGPSNAQTLFTSNSVCATRVVSTTGKAIMLSFSPDITPTGATGNVQAASTTVAYGAERYGCGAVTGYGFDASTTVTKSEFLY